MISNFIKLASIYMPKSPYVMVYMLQQVEYEAAGLWHWVRSLPDYRYLIRRKKLIITTKALSLLAAVYFFWLGLLGASIYLLLEGAYPQGALLLILTPWLSVAFLCFVAYLGSLALVAKRRKVISEASQIAKDHKAVKIAVLGSYGKTTMKELLATVLGVSKRVAATPGNKNVAISHARWLKRTVTDDEEILIFEYGEYRPGDIKKMAELTHPDVAVITGIAPNHLDNYSTYDELKRDIASVEKYIETQNLYVAASAGKELGLEHGSYVPFDDNHVMGWELQDKKSDIEGVSFTMRKNGTVLSLRSSLMGLHQVGPLALTAALGDKLGLKKSEIEKGISQTKPFEHRLQPRYIQGAWIIDDTYNGNIEGVRAGLELLSALPAKRKIYVTPGLVEQGARKSEVHREMGELIANAKPDVVVLMKNSVQSIIEQSLIEAGYKGELVVETDPLHYYENLEHRLAAGDLVLLQNDWTDNYV